MSIDLTDDGLDALLATPLEEPVDMGFSARVMRGVAETRLRQAKREAVLSLVAVALLLLVAALTPVGPALANVGTVLAGTPAVWFSGFLLLISSVIYKRVRA